MLRAQIEFGALNCSFKIWDLVASCQQFQLFSRYLSSIGSQITSVGIFNRIGIWCCPVTSVFGLHYSITTSGPRVIYAVVSFWVLCPWTPLGKFRPQTPKFWSSRKKFVAMPLISDTHCNKATEQNTYTQTLNIYHYQPWTVRRMIRPLICRLRKINVRIFWRLFRHLWYYLRVRSVWLPAQIHTQTCHWVTAVTGTAQCWRLALQICYLFPNSRQQPESTNGSRKGKASGWVLVVELSAVNPLKCFGKLGYATRRVHGL